MSITGDDPFVTSTLDLARQRERLECEADGLMVELKAIGRRLEEIEDELLIRAARTRM